jgi:hypothetical protein
MKTRMTVKILNESGYNQALLGMSLSFMTEGTNLSDWWTIERFDAMHTLAERQADKDGGHNKFLESIQMWIAVRAPRGWYQELDTYRVGMSKQSASSMHTIQRRELTMDDFEEGTSILLLHAFDDILEKNTHGFSSKQRLIGEALQEVKNNLPEGFLQTRILCCNYKTMRNIIIQRKNHYLFQWQHFIKCIQEQCEHPELLPF